MQKRQLLLIGSASFCAALIFAQTLPSTVLPSTVPLATHEHQPRSRIGGDSPGGVAFLFDLNGKKYAARMAREQVAEGPEWSPSATLPLSLAKAEEVARVELRKLGNDDSKWEVGELTLRRLPDETVHRWYCVVRLVPKVRTPGVISDTFYLPISFSGEPGRIEISQQ